MAMYYPGTVLPWAGLREEDRRFNRILLVALTGFFVIGAIIPNLSLPQSERTSEAALPPRIARIIEGPISSSLMPSVAKSGPGKPLGKQRSVDVAEQTAPRVRAASAHSGLVPRREVERVGVLAFSNELKALHKSVPIIKTEGPTGAQELADRDAEAKARGRSSLMAGLFRGSGGIDEDRADYGKVLGLSSLKGGAGDGGAMQGVVSQGGFPAGASDKPGKRRRAERSEDEIQEILDRHKAGMYAIYNRELRSKPVLHGKLVVSITIAPSGKVSDCRILYSELRAASLEKKLVLLIKRIDFGAKPEVPVVTTKVPIEFFPL